MVYDCYIDCGGREQRRGRGQQAEAKGAQKGGRGGGRGAQERRGRSSSRRLRSSKRREQLTARAWSEQQLTAVVRGEAAACGRRRNNRQNSRQRGDRAPAAHKR